MMSTAKRSYSPTIDDIRQYNIKRQRILNDLESLSLTQHQQQSPQTPLNRSTKHTEYIPDIEEFLINNQDDRDILESSRHVIDLNTEDQEKWIIPNSVIKIPGVTTKEAKFSYDRLKGRKKFELKFNKFLHKHDGLITNDEILYDYEVLRYWSLIKFIPDPWGLVNSKWEKWYFNVYKLQEFGNDLDSGRIEMLPDDYQGAVDLTNESDKDDNDLMIDDENENNTFDMNDKTRGNIKMLNNYGSYYGNSSFEATQQPQADHVSDDDAMDID